MYTKAWGELCRDAGTKPIHTRPYNPQCNGKAEAVVKKVKRYLNRFEVRDLDHANQLFGEYQKEYNRTPHSSLKYQTPLRVYRAKRRAGDIWGVM
ncbi:MAG: transposase [Candidatus Aenigmarchaeota archaeon]|nr:transposase [Candidatus Aenigmarchaeota archaeon]